MKKKFFTVAIWFMALFVIGCTDADRDGTEADPDKIYLDYRITGDEERDFVTVTLQFRDQGPVGDAVRLPAGGTVSLDDAPLSADSSKMNGVFYETSVPVGEFEGRHTILYRRPDGKKFSEEFDFRVMKLKTDIPAEIPRQDLQLQFSGMDSSDFIHLIMTDTSFYGNGIDRIDTVRDGTLTITARDLGSLHDGPVFFEVYREESWPLKETPSGLGRLAITYGLKRAFVLTGAAHQ